MNRLVEFVADSPRLRRALSSPKLMKRIAERFVLVDSLETHSGLFEDCKKKGFGVLLYPIEAADRQYVEAIKYLAQNGIRGSVSLRTPLLGLEKVAETAAELGVGIELDMRGPRTVDDALETYRKIKRVHPNAIICLQANLYRTTEDLERLADTDPLVRLVKGAFQGTYKTREAVDLNFLWLAKMLVKDTRKTYLATHDPKLIRDFLQFVEEKHVPTERFGFQMLHGVNQELQSQLRQEGHEVWKYFAYGEDWLPYLLNRLAERKENIFFALKALRGDGNNAT